MMSIQRSNGHEVLRGEGVLTMRIVLGTPFRAVRDPDEEELA